MHRVQEVEGEKRIETAAAIHRRFILPHNRPLTRFFFSREFSNVKKLARKMIFRMSLRWRVFVIVFITVCIPYSFGGTKYVPKWKKQVRHNILSVN